MDSPNISIVREADPRPGLRHYTVRFFDRTVNTIVTSDGGHFKRWIHNVIFKRYQREHDNHLVVGIGVQSREAAAAAHTVQICAGGDCGIFQLAMHDRDSVPSILRSLLKEPSIRFVGFKNAHHNGLLGAACGLAVEFPIDLNEFAPLRFQDWGPEASMEDLASRFLALPGVTTPDWVAASEWDQAQLSDDQVLFACVNPLVCCLVGVELEIWNLA